jgi:hypothetical protein
MRRFGRLLAYLGLALGLVTGLSIFLPVRVTGVPLIVGFGLVKLAFVSSLALIGAGAFVERAAIKSAERDRQLLP